MPTPEQIALMTKASLWEWTTRDGDNIPLKDLGPNHLKCLGPFLDRQITAVEKKVDLAMLLEGVDKWTEGSTPLDSRLAYLREARMMVVLEGRRRQYAINEKSADAQ